MMPADVPVQEPVRPTVMMSVPGRIPVACIKTAGVDYQVPQLLLLAILKQESDARPAISRNRNGSYDIGPAQLNTGSWVPYFSKKYGIKPEALAYDMCQAIRAMAYAIRTEANTKTCKGEVLWCGVGRYHAPNNPQASQRYVVGVSEKLNRMITTGRFD